MAKEYIEREAVVKLLKAACKECRETCEEFDGFYADCNQCIMHSVVNGVPSVPAADVAPVVHGRWIRYGVMKWYCSECELTIEAEEECLPNFCKDCGARIGMMNMAKPYSCPARKQKPR